MGLPGGSRGENAHGAAEDAEPYEYNSAVYRCLVFAVSAA